MFIISYVPTFPPGGLQSDCQYFLIVWKVSHFSRFTSLPHFHPWELEGLEILVRNETTASSFAVSRQPGKGCSSKLKLLVSQGAENNMFTWTTHSLSLPFKIWSHALAVGPSVVTILSDYWISPLAPLSSAQRQRSPLKTSRCNQKNRKKVKLAE